MYKIPLFKLNFDKREEQAVLSALRSNWISMGPKTMEFEEKFASILSIDYAVSLTNCTVALHLALKLLDVGKNDEVICPSLTFVATVNAIRYVNAIPIFADVTSYNDLTINPQDIQNKISSKTKAIIVMHYGGFPCNMDPILDIAAKYRLKVIEDACHGPLSEYNGKKLGTLGDIGCFSFFSNKNISTGEGGMLVTRNKDYFNRAKLLRSHGMTTLSYERSLGHSTDYDVIDTGYNYRYDDIRASIGLVQLDKLYEDLRQRSKIRQMYIERLCRSPHLHLPFHDNSGIVSNYIFPIILKNSNRLKRKKIREKLAKEGIQSSVHYPPVHKFSIYKDCNVNLPVTNYVGDTLISLPMYSQLTIEEVNFITEKLLEILV